MTYNQFESGQCKSSTEAEQLETVSEADCGNGQNQTLKNQHVFIHFGFFYCSDVFVCGVDSVVKKTKQKNPSKIILFLGGAFYGF